MRNEEVAQAFELLADLLEFKGENVFRIRSYRKAARTIRDLTENIAVVAQEGRLRKLPGVGEAIEKKIVQLVTTGRMEKLEEVKGEVPSGILDMLAIPGVSPRAIALAHAKLGVRTLDELAGAARSGRLAELPGMGAKKAEDVLKGIESMRRGASPRSMAND